MNLNCPARHALTALPTYGTALVVLTTVDANFISLSFVSLLYRIKTQHLSLRTNTVVLDCVIAKLRSVIRPIFRIFQIYQNRITLLFSLAEFRCRFVAPIS